MTITTSSLLRLSRAPGMMISPRTWEILRVAWEHAIQIVEGVLKRIRRPPPPLPPNNPDDLFFFIEFREAHPVPVIAVTDEDILLISQPDFRRNWSYSGQADGHGKDGRVTGIYIAVAFLAVGAGAYLWWCKRRRPGPRDGAPGGPNGGGGGGGGGGGNGGSDDGGEGAGGQEVGEGGDGGGGPEAGGGRGLAAVLVPIVVAAHVVIRRVAAADVVGGDLVPTELMVPAVEGTRNVLHAAGGARRVVVTSSVSAMVPSPGWPAGEVRDDIDYCQNNGVWYPASKTLADKASWKFAEENELCSQQCFDIISHITQVWYPASKMLADKATWNFAENELDVVVVNPGTVLGLKIPPTVNAIMAIFLQLLEGCTQEYADFFMGAVHVEDVALAHILLYGNPSATGRHLCVFSGDYSKRKDPAVLKQKEPILELITSAPVNRHKIKFTKQDTSSLWFLCKQEGGLLNITNQACQFFTEAEECGNKDFCPFDDFKKQKKIVEPHLKHDYDRLCKIKKLVVTEGPSAFSSKLSGSILAERVPC